MIKRLFVITALVVVLAIPTMAAAFERPFVKSLCDFPFGDGGFFEVRYDQRIYDSDYFNKSYPNGGIAFSLWLGLFQTEAERDELANRVRRVIFRNKTTGSSHILTEPFLYMSMGFWSGEFTIWLGHTSLLIGDWRIIVQYKFHRYTATFTITEEMLDQIPPIPVDPEVRWRDNDPETGIIDIIAPETNGDQYLLYVFDEDGNIMTIEQIYDGFVELPNALPNMLGKMARIETRFYDMDWPILRPSETCNADGMNPGGKSRSCIYFKTTASLEMLSATGTAPMNGVWGSCYGPGADYLPGGLTTTDTMGVWTFTGSSVLRQVFSYASKDGSCGGNGTEIPSERIPFTITVDGEKSVVWSDGQGPDGLSDTPTVSTFTINAGPEGILKHILYMDDRTTPWKIYRPEEEHCGRDANGYPLCLLNADVRIKQ